MQTAGFSPLFFIKPLLAFVGLLILAMAFKIGLEIFLKKQKKKIQNAETWPFYARRLLTQPEQILYHRMVKALPDYLILTQVQLSRILEVKSGFNKWEWNNRINRMSLDFVVCKPDSSVIAAIELDDSSHLKEDRFEADNKKDKALASANIPIIRCTVMNMPDEETIRKTINNVNKTSLQQEKTTRPVEMMN